MSVFKCKMCGATLNISEKERIVQCEYCCTQQTIPSSQNERIKNLFNRANALRYNKEFDKSAGIYESIVAECPEEAEAYWGLCLCKYGIEYVDDTRTGTKIPTCHRTLTGSILNDPDYIQACNYADEQSKEIYNKEANAIAQIQKEILAIAATATPYDIFICYKETDDATGERTEDSIIAQDIYTELIQEGYKVFFSRMSLRNVAGSKYEPYIFSALTSAKLMLVIGTNEQYFNAVWVKNEWSRYLQMMQKDSNKHLIPCYRGINPYNMPLEFGNLQALDIGSATFYKSLSENIARFVVKKEDESKVYNASETEVEITQETPKKDFMETSVKVAKSVVDHVYHSQTKSKMLAAGLMLFGIGDLYLRDYRRFLKKMLFFVITFGIGSTIMQIRDIYGILTGKINCDAKGVPLV